MLMPDLLSHFRQFCSDEILAKSYDYLVPIEVKGILLLNEALAERHEDRSRIRYRRSFDFMPESALQKKSAALIDDTVVLGRTLNRAQDALAKRGLGRIDKYTCLVYDDPDRAPYRRLDGIHTSEWLSQANYDELLEDLSALTLRRRPVYPDHLHFDITFQEPLPTDAFFETYRSYGSLVEYHRGANERCCSIHYPRFAPTIPGFAADTGPNKLRIAASYLGDRLTVSPGLFPCLKDALQARESDKVCAAIYQAMRRHSQDHADQQLNQYESFTLAMRISMVRNFVDTLRLEGFPVQHCRLQLANLNAYYGAKVTNELHEIVAAAMADSSGSLPTQSMPPQEEEETPEPVRDVHVLTETCLTAIERTYRAFNKLKNDRYDWESAGLNIAELAATTKLPRSLASIAVEILNDYGYAVPLPLDGTKQHLQRTYRSTELGGRRLSV